VARSAVQPTAGSAGGTPSPRTAPVIGTGRPPWWLLALSALVTVAVTVDLLTGGVLERLDLEVSDVVKTWDLRHSDAYWGVWGFIPGGGRGLLLNAVVGRVGWGGGR